MEKLSFLNVPNISVGQFVMQFQAILQSTNIAKARLVVLGTFSAASILNDPDTIQLITKELKITFPLIANVDVSHTEPSYPFYIGGFIELNIETEEFRIEWGSDH